MFRELEEFKSEISSQPNVSGLHGPISVVKSAPNKSRQHWNQGPPADDSDCRPAFLTELLMIYDFFL